ncbi:MAG TPA: dihydropteroate synthase [Candidatus Thermoplasmatota archaeon]|nr:dihydropteroate synthase [Candidatus Thermoplasmatota archaeon]
MAPPLEQPARFLPLARGRRLAIDRPLVMGILNATPDSFSDGGRLHSPGSTEFAESVQQMLADGADILDVGGESTRPGHKPVAAAEELRRVVPVIQAIRRLAPQAVVSIDTSKAAVARAALAAGADLVNDVSALGDPGMAGVVREAGCSVVLMRHRPLPGADLVAAARAQLDTLVASAVAQGVPETAILVDPGLGFGDPPGGDVAANLALLRSSSLLSAGRPVLVGASRKRFLGTMTGEAVADRRVGASVAAAVLAVQGGADVVRVHDVKETVQALRVLREASRST